MAEALDGNFVNAAASTIVRQRGPGSSGLGWPWQRPVHTKHQLQVVVVFCFVFPIIKCGCSAKEAEVDVRLVSKTLRRLHSLNHGEPASHPVIGVVNRRDLVGGRRVTAATE